jgi:demethoxyubiquinone hydroxylase (CLK1/Coq7/Cat5 family)
MNKTALSLNFMYCMERFATQIYLTQMPAFKKDSLINRQLKDASENEKSHVDRLRAQLKKLNQRVYPLGFLFQFGGVTLGVITRLSGKRNLFNTDTFVEKRAIKDYNGFLKSVQFDVDTVALIRGVITEEEIHVENWEKAAETFRKSG